jgi:hypothetical protein
MDPIFDLFGDPVPASHGKRGRPEHIATQKNRNKVNMLLALGWVDGRIARALNITPPTLRKHYFFELKYRETARDRLDAKLSMTFWEQFMDGNTGAGREFVRLLERNDMAFGHAAPVPAREVEAKSAKKLGKKEALNREAETGHEGTGWGALLQ